MGKLEDVIRDRQTSTRDLDEGTYQKAAASNEWNKAATKTYLPSSCTDELKRQAIEDAPRRGRSQTGTARVSCACRKCW
jgi:hypothetical protein